MAVLQINKNYLTKQRPLFSLSMLATFVLLLASLICPSTAHAVLVQIRIAADDDDAEQQLSDGAMYLGSEPAGTGFLELGYFSETRDIGLRFQNVTIPQGSIINSAVVEFTAGATDTRNTRLVVAAEATDNAAQFTSTSYDISSRSTTTSSVSWNVASWTSGSTYQTSDFASAIQEIVLRSGWSTGNSMVVIIGPDSACSNSNCARVAEEYESGAADAALLIIDYTPPPEHFAISHDSSGDTCNAESVTITKHSSSHVVDTAYSGTITLSTSTGNGSWSLLTGSGTLTDLGGGDATYAYAAGDNGEVELGLANSVAETLNVNVTDGTYSENASEDSDLVFSAATATTYRDEFNAVSFSGGDGTGTWTTNWLENGEADGAGAGDVQVMSDLSSNVLRIHGSSSQEGVEREADVSGATTATLSFDYRAESLDNGSEFVTVEVSGDGGSTWVELDSIKGPKDDVSYQAASYDITTYIASNTRIRFLSSTSMEAADAVYFDNIQISKLTPLSCASLDHFDIDHDGLGISCLAESVTVTAELADNSTFTSYTGTITLDTQNSNGTWTLDTGTLANFNDATPGDGQATYTFDGTENGVASFFLDYLSGPAGIDVDVYEGATRDDDLEGNLVFSPSGFTVTNVPLAVPFLGVVDTVIPAKTAATDFTLYLAAYGQTATDPTCGIIEAYGGAKNLKFWSTYNNPNAGTLPVTVNTVDAFASEALADLGGTQSVTFTNGQASITTNYADVGQITLAMKDDTVTADLPTGIRGTSTSFVVKPAGFVLSNIIRTSDSFANPGSATDESGAKFMAAGENFSVTVTAVNSLSNPTPNYGQETPAEAVLLTPTLVAAGSANNPAIGFTTGFDGFVNGVDTGTDFNWPEVGIITLTPSVSSGSYLGAGDVTGTTTGNVGRFYPSYFTITPSVGHNFATQCGSFTYMGQSFPYNSAAGVTVTAKAAGGTTTTNYDGVWWKLGDFSESYSHNGGIPATASLDASSAGHVALACANCDGAGSATFNGTLSYTTTAQETLPFTGAIDIGFTLPADSDGACYDGTTNPCNTNDGDSAQAFTIAAIGFNSGAEQRSGRGYAIDVHGSYATIGDVLTMPVGTEYYFSAASGWITNATDNCTSYTYVKTDSDIVSGVTPVSPVSLVNGVGDLAIQLTADAGSPGGVASVTFTWAAWLNGTANASATFGIFRGDDRFLFWREGP